MSDPYLDEKDPVWLILAPAVRWFKDRPNCADATEALARAQTARALIEWYQCLPEPVAEQAEPEERSLIRLHAHTVQKGDVVVQGVAAELPWIEVTDVVTRPDDAVEIYGTYNLNEAEKVADRWTVHRMASLTVER